VSIGRAAALGALLLSSLALGRAEAEIIERVVAVVNDKAIFLSDVRRRAVPYLERLMELPSEAQRSEARTMLYRQIVSQLIDEELIRQAAVKMEIRVTNADVERAVANVIQQNQLTPEEFWEAIAEQGMSEAQYRQSLRDQLLHLKVMNQRVRSRVNITERDVRREYDTRARQANRALRFRASHIFFPLPASAGILEVTEVREKATSVREAIDSKDAFERAVREHGGGDLGWLSQGDLPRELERSLMALAPGEFGPPVRGSAGYHIFFVLERERSGGSVAPPFEAVKDEIYRAMLDEAMDRQEALFLEELKREADIRNVLESSKENPPSSSPR
jgi:peptidyl-prolyl cis-trans isomerase SurA